MYAYNWCNRVLDNPTDKQDTISTRKTAPVHWGLQKRPAEFNRRCADDKMATESTPSYIAQCMHDRSVHRSENGNENWDSNCWRAIPAALPTGLPQDTVLCLLITLTQRIQISLNFPSEQDHVSLIGNSPKKVGAWTSAVLSTSR